MEWGHNIKFMATSFFCLLYLFIHTYTYIYILFVFYNLSTILLWVAMLIYGGRVFGKQITTTTTLLFVQKYKSWMVCPANSWKATRGGARQVHV